MRPINLSSNLLATVLLASSQLSCTLAAPTRTNCQCTIVSNASPPPPLHTPSTDHWTPTSPSDDEPASLAPLPISISLCATLGPELDRLRHTEPDLFDLYLRLASSDAQQQETVTHDYASAPQTRLSPLASPQNSRIVCVAADAPSASPSPHEFQTSPLGLYALQAIIVLVILACVLEGLNVVRCFFHTPSSPHSTNSLRLTGAEQRLRALPDDACTDESLRAYPDPAPTRYCVCAAAAAKRQFSAYEDDSDDEVNRPVM